MNLGKKFYKGLLIGDDGINIQKKCKNKTYKQD